MALPGRSSRWDVLPDEIVLQIISYLDPFHITRLQLVSRKLQKLCLDDELWKRRCFEDSSWYQRLKSRRRLITPNDSDDEPRDGAVQLNPEASGDPGAGDEENTNGDENSPEAAQRRWRSHRRQELQDMANWDPSFPDERLCWYSEYVHRNGPACVNWLQTPRIRERGVEAIIEARGMELYYPYDGKDGLGTMLAVSPLDDGSICLWDVKGTRNKPGSILATSKSDILFIDGPGSQNTRRSKRVDTGVTECVSIDNHRHRAYFAVQSHLIEIDLERLEVVSRESFEWSITALSKIQNDVPLTVGTSLGIHLFDPRVRARPAQVAAVERVDQNDIFKSIFDPTPLLPYAPLSQPTPVSIVHLPLHGAPDLVSHDIYVAGRFSNILHYDRRKFPVIMDSIYSGATINSMAATPHPFSCLDSEIRRQGELSAEQVAKSKEGNEGWTLVAGGTYKSKGSLEIFGLSQAVADPVGREMMQTSTMKNRQTAASAAILSVANHGSKIVFSDGAGSIKWFERDGLTECRRLRIGHCEGDDAPSLFASMSAAGELARKIVSTKSREAPDQPNDDNVLFWTGERLGLVSFTPRPLYHSKDFEDEPDPDTLAEEEERRRYADQMRDALDFQADEVRYMTTFGSGTPRQ